MSSTCPLLSRWQHAGGVSFVAAIIEGLMPSGASVAPVILDLMGYDACAATYALTRAAAGELLVSVVSVMWCNIFSSFRSIGSHR